MANCPQKRENKGFAGKEKEESSEEELDPKYKRKQSAYLALRDAYTSSDSESSAGEEELTAHFAVAYRECKEPFPSGNQLHSHLKSFTAHAINSKPSVLNLTAQLKGSYSEGISNCTETRVKAYKAINAKQPDFTAVINTGFSRSAVN